ncbi:hypothetical protein SmJEL517_g05384 [Synchytrium microbalum]|uniref:sn-1-specific diacylglycerol lipase n=1 Tax=Synchytrium microbalum TaxID=1806994 RepID=A0A507BVJ7_9FUNG|nr:uncharacterized protein SmJEL517_g05384 [Synchytrium microbalum]TPX31248.1 hypothetical protein SmJEL517_g05384 [Synchytrium microbalum]
MVKMIALGGRRWNVASDDLFVPATLQTIIQLGRIVLIISFVCATRNCLELDVFYALNIIILTAVVAVNLTTSIFSLRGTVSDDRPRRIIPKLAPFYVGLTTADILLQLAGGFMIKEQRGCEFSLLLIYVYASLIITVVFHVVLLTLIYDNKSNDTAQDIDSAHLWTRRLKWIFYGRNIRDNHDVSGALKTVSRVLADFFDHDSNLTASDVAAGLVLLRRQQMARDSPDTITFRGLPTDSFDHGVHTSRNLRQFMDFHFPAPKTVAEHVSLQFGTSGYCCCGILECLPKTDKSHPDLLYISYHNDIFLSPFLVAVDRERRTLVIAIRGSMSISDIITDLVVESVPLPGMEDNTFTHGGMLSSAKRILNELQEQGVLGTMKRDYGDYDLVVVGHSLGGGTASVLTHLLRSTTEFTEAKCFVYSPPAVIASATTAAHFEGFCTTVVLGADVVSRLNRKSIHSLQQNLTRLVSTCRERKVDVLGRAFIDWLWKGMGVSRRRAINSYPAENTPMISPAVSNDDLEHNTTTISPSRWRGFDDEEELYLPGKIVYFERVDESRAPSGGKKVYRAVWAEKEEFLHIVISSTMLSDHLPNVLGEVLRNAVHNIAE